jgi:hypothetical protein
MFCDALGESLPRRAADDSNDPAHVRGARQAGIGDARRVHLVLTLDTHAHLIPAMHSDTAAAMDAVFTL